MKALILVGGFGTRLRPLTENRPKPLVEFCNLPMMTYQMIELIKAGVNHIILAVSYKADQMNKFVEEQEKLFGIRITLSHETEPLGTAGPLALARDQLLAPSTSTSAITANNNNNNNYNHCNGDCSTKDTNQIISITTTNHNNKSSTINHNDTGANNACHEDDDDDGVPFFVLNSDIICNYPFEQMLKFHKQNKGEGTIVVTRVEEPSKYGVVVYDTGSGLVERFVEKPSTFVSDKINAGLYILSKSILKRIKLEPTSIEREIFPAMAADKKLFAIDLEGYWMDIGQPPDYLRGLSLYLNWLNETSTDLSANTKSRSLTKQSDEHHRKGIVLRGNVLIDSSAILGENCTIGPDVCIGPDVQIADCSSIQSSTILAGASISCNVSIENSIVGWNCKIGKGVELSNICVLGEGVEVCDETKLSGARVWPGLTISLSHDKPSDIIESNDKRH